MAGYTILSLAVHGNALAARVRFEAPDGRRKDLQCSWPSETGVEAIQTACEALYTQFLAEPASTPAVHPAMGLVGRKQDLGHLSE